MRPAATDVALPAIDLVLDPTWPQLNLPPGRSLVGPGGVKCPTSNWRRRTTDWRPGERLIVTFERVEPAEVWRVDVSGDGIVVSQPTDDTALPSLKQVLDALPGSRIVSYKPGSSCVIASDDNIVRKVFRTGTVGAVADRMVTLSKLRALPMAPRIPEVLAVDERLDLIEMTFLTGRALRSVVYDSSLSISSRITEMKMLGQCLAALWLEDLVALPEITLIDDVREVSIGLPAMHAADIEMAERTMLLLDRLADVGLESRAERLGPSHGALRVDQVVCGEPPGFVDLDGVCSAGPERDVANLDAYLWWRGVRHQSEAKSLALLSEAVVEGMMSAGVHISPENLAFQRAASLLKIATRRYRSVAFDEWPLVSIIIDEAERVMNQ